MNEAKVVQRNWTVARRYWRGSLIFSFLSPTLYLAAMGLGVGALVAQRSPGAFGEFGYLPFFATGMLAAATMQTGTFESSFPIMSKITWQRNYEAMLATPLGVINLFLGELGWLTIRLSMVAVPFFVVMSAFRVPKRPTAILAIPAAVLTGLAFGAAIMALSAKLKTSGGFSSVFRFVITPLFLFSGTFFPLDRLPPWIKTVANATPLYHGIELVRGLSLYGISLRAAAWHIAYLVGFLCLGTFVGIRLFKKKLVQ
jgi:lipooligosaccharide transport system permease protein